MAQILVRNLSPDVVANLKRRHRQGGRSLQAEAKAILEETSKVNPAAARALADRIRARFKGRKMANSLTLLREDRRR